MFAFLDVLTLSLTYLTRALTRITMQAVAIVGQFYDKGLPALDACRFLIAKAALCWRKFEGDYRDDITAMVVYLDDVLEKLAEEDPDTVDGASAAGGAGAPSAAAA